MSVANLLKSEGTQKCSLCEEDLGGEESAPGENLSFSRDCNFDILSSRALVWSALASLARVAII